MKWSPLVSYILLINLLGFLVFGLDKRRAVRHRWRVPEAALLLLAAAGGAGGELVALLLFRHKTRHKKFSWGLPLLLILQIAALVYFGLLR